MNKHLLFSFSGLFTFGASCLAQVPNGGFEQWYDAGGYNDPVDWVSFNSISFPTGGQLTCEEGMPGAVGAAYVKLTSKDVPGIGVIPGTLFSSPDSFSLEGFPHAEASGSLIGKWQYTVMPGDEASVSVTLSKWNTVTMQRDIIAAGIASATGSLSTWQNFTATISYVTAIVPDSALIYIYSSSGTAVAGSTISVDDLAFAAGTGVNEQASTVALELGPSPASDILRISTPDRIASVSLVDTRGREVRRILINEVTAELHIADLSAGTYIAQVRFDNGRVEARPFIKN